MEVTHKFRLVCRCPVNDDVDVYECAVTVYRLVRCEDVLAAAERHAGTKVFQEALTQALADELRGTVETRGTHVGGKVDTVCTCRPDEEG